MASVGSVVWTGRALQCLKCGQQVEAKDGNMELAVQLHLQAHQNLETTTSQPALRKPDTNYSCPICKENVEILYNDVKLSLKLHSMKHKDGAENRAEDQQSNCSSGKSKNSSKKSNKPQEKVQQKSKNSESTILDDIFNTMPPGLKAHRGFVLRNAEGKTYCSVCSSVIENTLNISEHLKTKLHEDNTIHFLKNVIPKELLSCLDFVSFYGSNLCCNLCRCKIDLCSNNAQETIINIVSHNAEKGHLSKKKDPKCQSGEISTLLQSLSQLSPIINENKSFVDVKMLPQFKCNVCVKNIAYDEDDATLLKNFMSHFTTAGHAKCQKAASVLKLFMKSNTPGKEKHNLKSTKGNIHCSLCACSIEVDLKKLEEHVRKSSVIESNTKLPFSKQIEDALTREPSLMRTTTDQKPANKDALDLKSLLGAMPPPFKNVSYVVETEKGQAKCLVCECIIPASHFNLKTHLTGNKHKKNEEAKNTEQKTSGSLKASSALETSQMVDKVFNYLVRNDPVVKSNESILVKFGNDGQHYFCTMCGILVPSSPDINFFRSNIYSHVQLEMHQTRYNNQSQANSTNASTKQLKQISLEELFNALPPSLGSERQFIKANQYGVNILFCTACKSKVPAHVKCLQEHVEGNAHAGNVEKYKQSLLAKLAGLAMDKKSNEEDTLFINLMQTDKVIKLNAKNISKKGEDYFCTLCEATIKQSLEPKLLKDNFLSHFNGQKHSKSMDKVVSNMVDKLMGSDPVIKAEKSYLKVVNRTVYCILCATTMPSGIEVEPLRKNMVSHFSGTKHKNNKISQASSLPQAATKQSTKGNQPAPTKQPIPSSNPFMTGLAPMNSQPNYNPTLGQIQPLLPNQPFMPIQPARPNQPTVPMPNQLNMFANVVNSPYAPNTNSFNPVVEAFQSVPLSLQADIKYIKTGSIEGYLSCTLCNNTINPHYLKEHLIEGNHIKEKNNFEERLSHWKPQL